MSADHSAVVTIYSVDLLFGEYTLVAMTPFPVSKMVICNCSNTPACVISVGPVGSEVDLVGVQSKGTTIVDFGLNQIPVGSRIAVFCAAGGVDFSSYFSVSLLR